MNKATDNIHKVLCLVETHYNDGQGLLDQDINNETKYLKEPCTFEKIMPLIDHPHNDVENGQKETHYHADVRFFDMSSPDRYVQELRISLPLASNRRLEYRMLEMINKYHYITPTNLITNSKLKHKCIHKGKCPHRGYDLSNVEAFDGEITCPLHGLKFDAETKKLKIGNMVVESDEKDTIEKISYGETDDFY